MKFATQVSKSSDLFAHFVFEIEKFINTIRTSHDIVRLKYSPIHGISRHTSIRSLWIDIETQRLSCIPSLFTPVFVTCVFLSSACMPLNLSMSMLFSSLLSHFSLSQFFVSKNETIMSLTFIFLSSVSGRVGATTTIGNLLKSMEQHVKSLCEVEKPPFLPQEMIAVGSLLKLMWGVIEIFVLSFGSSFMFLLSPRFFLSLPVSICLSVYHPEYLHRTFLSLAISFGM